MCLLGLSWLASGWSRGVPAHSWVSLGRSWVLLGRSWAVLGRSWPLLGRSWPLLGCSWPLLGRCWTLSAALGALLGRSWPLGWQDGRPAGVESLRNPGFQASGSPGRIRRIQAQGSPGRRVLTRPVFQGGGGVEDFGSEAAPLPAARGYQGSKDLDSRV